MIERRQLHRNSATVEQKERCAGLRNQCSKKPVQRHEAEARFGIAVEAVAAAGTGLWRTFSFLQRARARTTGVAAGSINVGRATPRFWQPTLDV
ncbi:MAG: hypothetical protein EOQ62_15735 [Mesorhizobium sp.]|uniref:hypothetical protein n=1 Tax=Mesorhizobium sp. TaxID=1871066 RepID=UPI000FEA4D70|nr:hypothetical protein [Mesorhizobium sp.]RWG46050.1 MAG: hypothetical protein EOQ62_15735 [Mesorhizobium sp.]